MFEITGKTFQPDTIPQERVDHFQELALAIDANASLPIEDRLWSEWVFQDNYDADQARAFGVFWWRSMATGYSYFLNPSFLSALEPSVDAEVTFEECIHSMHRVLAHLESLEGDEHKHATDGMTLARSYGRALAQRQAFLNGGRHGEDS